MATSTAAEPRSGCSRTSADRQRPRAPRRAPPRGARWRSPRSACAARSVGEPEAEGDLGELRGLNGEPAGERDPGPRAVDRATRAGERTASEQEQRPGIRPRSRQPHPLLAEPAHEQRQGQPDGRRHEMPHEVGRAVGAHRGRPDEQRADDGSAGRRDESPTSCRAQGLTAVAMARAAAALRRAQRIAGRSQLAAPLDVLGHRLEQLVDAVEVQGRPDVGGELDHDPLVVEVEVVAVEDVGLDGAPVVGRRRSGWCRR